MCGIVGLLATSAPLPGKRLSEEAAGLRAFLTDLRDAVLSSGRAPDEPIARIEAGLQGLRSFETLFRAPCEQALEKELRALARDLRDLLEAILSTDDESLPLARQETRNRVRILCLDGLWAIEQDLFGAMEGIRDLNRGPWALADRERIHHLFRIDYTLRNIGRIEVRGRDSAGISLLAAFDDASSRDAFLARLERDGHSLHLRERQDNPDFSAFAVIGDGKPGYIFTYKVAREIGRMGENIAKLRGDMRDDPLLQCLLSTAGVTVNVISHTRWASNGVISEPNAHPQDNRLEGDTAESGRICCVLNGDIDNFVLLLRGYAERTGRAVRATITTDAKIIPLLIGEHVSRGRDFLTSLRLAVLAFEGSFAIAAHHLDEPGRIYLALKGSGQSLYIGLRDDALVAASELYGVVEATSRFLKMNGEWVSESGAQGQIVVLDQDRIGSEGALSGWALDGSPLPEEALRERQAEITTRDICLGEYSHFFLKEIHDSVASVEKTLRGRCVLKGEGGPRLLLDESAVPDRVIEGISAGTLRRIYCIGQGTAAVAAAGIACVMAKVLEPLGLEVTATKATELSGYLLDDRMDDCLVVAVSQSGTTADTNRTVDVVRGRGACCIGIINRRNSDLVYRADGVMYTSDGRDIEMSVASTKAFYSQIVAGYLLALYLGSRTGALSPEALRRGIEAVQRLPMALRQVLSGKDDIARAARTWAATRLHWAVAGSGPNHVAAQELRIKLSELCYKSIACDFLEDKKHIDLSSEPLILVCAAGLDSVNLRDAVKEVAIFKAHRSIPIVFAGEGAERFAPYAAETIRCPAVGEGLDFIPEVMAGHLLGFYAAQHIDSKANALRALRTRLVEALSRYKGNGDLRLTLEDMGALVYDKELASIDRDLLMSGAAAACLDAGTASRLTLALRYLQGKLPLDDLPMDFGVEASVPALIETGINTLTAAINQLTRPIDAIKHQAKTVTVGISREEIRLEGLVAGALRRVDARPAQVSRSSMEVLKALEPLLAAVEGLSYYRVTGLNAKNQPTPQTRIERVRSEGIAASMKSRIDNDAALRGTKWLCLKERSVYLGKGRNDGRSIAIIPLAPAPHAETASASILLLHIAYRESAEREALVRLLKRYNRQYDRIVAAATELNLAWDDDLLNRIPIVDLLDESLDPVLKLLRSP